MSPSRQVSSQTVVSWVLQIAIGSWVGVGLGKWLVHTPLLPLLSVLLLGLIFLLSITVHEAGHWLGSYYAKLRCYSVSVLWLHMERRGPRWHLWLGKRRPGLYGHVKALPVSDTNLRRQMVLFVAAGPFASLLTGILALSISHWGWHPTTLSEVSQSSLFLTEGLWLLGWWSALTGLKNLLPFTIAAGNYSDGKMLYQLYRGGPELEREHATLRLTIASQQGVRPRYWDVKLLALLLEAPPYSALACSAHTYAYMHHLDKANIATARQHLKFALDSCSAGYTQLKQQLCCEAAYLALVHDHKPSEIADWLAAAEQAKPLSKEQRQFTGVLLACGAGRWDKASELLLAGGQDIAKLNDAGGQLVEADRFRELSAFIEQHSNLAPAQASYQAT